MDAGWADLMVSGACRCREVEILFARTAFGYHFGRNMGLKKNKIINIHLQNNYKTCCYGVTTV